ncbi:MAG: type 4 pilus major pilin [Roseovarius sp.]|nr:type 4 pilus major pilin [Roseovarius sp.]MCY4290190.1 type 4 pilus major pilin [Roseovarius sp.]MCY4314953.1 type 4 pilus major pilin [Roseovarius sp.]
MLRKKKTLRGLTLMEALLFLGLAAIVIVGAFALYNNASSTSRLNQAKSQLQTYISGIKSLYSTRNNFTSVTTSLVVNSGIAPAEAVDGAALINPWGGLTTISANSAQPRQFRVTFEDIPRDACTAMLSAGLIKQGIVYQIGVGATLRSVDIDPSVAIGLCGSSANDVLFVAR